VAVLVVALWVSAAIESRLLAGATDNLSVRKMAANAVRALLLLVGVLLALSAAGIPSGRWACWAARSAWASAWACRSWRPTTSAAS
jgi:hypothetical protein